MAQAWEEQIETAEAAVVKLVAAIRRLPLMPAVAGSLSAYQDIGALRSVELSRVIGSDAALAGQLLRLANAPGRGSSGQIGTIGAALHLLGRDALLGLVSEALTWRLPQLPLLTELWREQLFCAALARQLQGRHAEGGSESAYLAGLLHDVGGLVLLARWPLGYARLLRRNRHEARARRAAEQRRFGVDAARLGAELLRQWCLPAEIVMAVGSHADAEAPRPALAASVWRACRLARQAAALRPPWVETAWMREAGFDLPGWRQLADPIDALSAPPHGRAPRREPFERGANAGGLHGPPPPELRPRAQVRR